MSGDRITTDRVRELRDGATPGPWTYDMQHGGTRPITDVYDVIARKADGLLSAAAPDLAADLLDARAEIARLTRQYDDVSARLTAAERERVDQWRAGHDAGVRSVGGMTYAEHEAEIARLTAALAESETERRALSSHALCLGCRRRVQRIDEDGLCLTCGGDVVVTALGYTEAIERALVDQRPRPRVEWRPQLGVSGRVEFAACTHDACVGLVYFDGLAWCWGAADRFGGCGTAAECIDRVSAALRDVGFDVDPLPEMPR